MKWCAFAFLILSIRLAVADTYTGVVSEVKHFRDGGVAVDLDGKFPREKMILYVPASDLSTVGALPPESTKVTASGSITSYRGVPEINIYESSQWHWDSKL